MSFDNIENYTNLVSEIDKKYGIKRDASLTFIQLLEEVGELAKEINKPNLRHSEIDRENLKGEFADVFLQLLTLAKLLEVNLPEALDDKIKILKKRHDLS